MIMRDLGIALGHALHAICAQLRYVPRLLS
jgi:hypothetical protein